MRVGGQSQQDHVSRNWRTVRLSDSGTCPWDDSDMCKHAACAETLRETEGGGRTRNDQEDELLEKKEDANRGKRLEDREEV